MAAEMIEKIVEAENQCAQRLKDAGLQADSIVASAHCEAERILTQAKSDAAFALNKALEKAQSDGKALYDKKCSEADEAVKQLEKYAKDNRTAGINAVIAKIIPQ